MRYVIDSRYYRGSVVTVFSDDAHNDSEPGETLEMLQQRCKNPHLTAVTPERLAFLQRRYRRSLQEPFREIGREEYYRLYNAMPPLRSVRDERFFAGEAYMDDLHLFCFRLAGRYFAAVRSIHLSDRELEDQIEALREELDYRPALIVGEKFSGSYGCYNRTARYRPYGFGMPERHSFIMHLRSHTGSEREDRAGRRELAGLLRQLRRNCFRYVFFYGKDEDPLRFFDWLRRNDYTLEVHGTLFRFHPESGYADFHGNVCEYSAAFHYRIYSRELFQNIIDQLRTVKRHQAWLRR